MKTSVACAWHLAAGLVTGIAAVSVLATPTAQAAPGPCTAAGVATTASGVLNEAGGYLGGHPEANDVLTNAVQLPPEEARSTVRGYFVGHLDELAALQRIAKPLTDLENQCGVTVSPAQLATLFDVLAE